MSRRSLTSWWNSLAQTWKQGQRRSKRKTQLGIESLETRLVPATNLVAAYNFDAGSGNTLVDVSGHGNNGTITNAQWVTTGQSGGALLFSGAPNSMVTVPSSASLNLTTGMTLEAWVDPTTVHSQGPGHWISVLTKGDSTGSGPLSYSLNATDGNTTAPAGEALINGKVRIVEGGPKLVANKWAYLAVTFDGSKLTEYLNGTVVKTVDLRSSNSITTTNDPLTIGGDSLGWMFQGRVDNVRIYNGALSQSAVVADMNTPVPSAPQVISVTPGNKTINVLPTTNVTATFNEGLNASTVNSNTVQLKGASGAIVPASITYDSATHSIILNPSGSLAKDSPFTFTILGGANGIKDAAGHVMASTFTSSFTTDSPPPASAALSVSETGPSSVTAGTKVTYTITVTNTGTSAAQGVVVTDTLPAGATNATITPVSGNNPDGLTFVLSGGTVTSASGTVAVGSTDQFQIVVTAPSTLAAGAAFNDSVTVTTTTNNTGSPTSAAVNNTITPAATTGTATASFVKLDTTTSGAWQGVYGQDGYNVIDGASNYPAYAQVTPSGQSNYIWAASTSDPRALTLPGGGAVGGVWYSSSTFTVDVNLTDGKTHGLELYLLDWDRQGRMDGIQILDANTGAVLASQSASNFTNGEYLVFNVSGHVKLQFTDTSPGNLNTVLSGLFFDPAWTNTPPPPPPTTAALSVSETGPTSVTAGTTATYTVSVTNAGPAAAQGVVITDSLPAGATNATITPVSGNNPDGLTFGPASGGKFTSATGTVAAGNTDQFQIVVTAPSTLSSGAAFNDSVTVTTTTNNTGSPTSDSVNNSITTTGGGTTGTGGTSASFLRVDTTTSGSWQGVYGKDGYNVIDGATSYPSYAQVSVSGESNFVWATMTSDPRALTVPGSGGVGGVWYSPSTFTVDVNLTDGKTHGLELYLLDWDQQGRMDGIKVLDANSGALLASQSASNFINGEYLLFNVSGHVKLQFTDISPKNLNTVLSGLFFDPAWPTTWANLSVANTGPSTVTAGTTVTYTVSVTNAGPFNAQGVVLTDTVPAGATNVTITPVSGQNPDGLTFGALSNGVFTSNSGIVAVNHTDTFLVVATAPAALAHGSPFDNTFSLTSTTENIGGPSTATVHNIIAYSNGDDPLLKAVPNQSSFSYLGSFYLPTSFAGHDTAGTMGGLTLRYVNGRLDFLSTGSAGDGSLVYEMSYPGLGTGANIPTAQVVQNWGDVYDGHRYVGNNGGSNDLISGAETYGLYYDQSSNRLYWNYGFNYNATNPYNPSLGYSTLNDATGVATGVGAWSLSNRYEKMDRGGVTPIPQWFADRFTNGDTLGVGFGGYFSVISSGGYGPALAAIAPPDINTNPDRTSLPNIPLLGYPYGSGVRAHRDTDYVNYYDGGSYPGTLGAFQPSNGVGYWTMSDIIYGAGSWIDTPSLGGMLYIAKVGQGAVWYQNSDRHAQRGSFEWMVYDPNDLAKVASGQLQQWQIQPKYEWITPDLPMPIQNQTGWDGDGTAQVGGTTFDPTTNRLYVEVNGAYANGLELFPEVYVFQVGPPPSSTTPASSSIVDNTSAGFSTTGAGWSAQSGGYSGSHQVNNAAPGAATATFQQTGLATGSYTLQATWNALASNTAAAVYQIYDNATLLKTITVNQQIAPTGSTYGGVAFQNLATVQITSGTLRVVELNQGSGTMDADAIRVSSAPSGSVSGPAVGSKGGVDTFSALVSGPTQLDTQSGYTYTWHFGDGTTATGKTVDHAFSTAGTYDVWVTVIASDGTVGIFDKTVVVS
jgi:uncharacterized repeat protein (TIGR01451 family)